MTNQLVDTLIAACLDNGVNDVCIGAGSRSTALLQALAKYEVNIHPFFDERAVGFLALGITKKTNNPVMVITTSGSAVSNLYPAITEATYSHHNLIICTADRPIRLQGTSSNQTINQNQIFNNILAEIQLPEDTDNKNEFINELSQALNKQHHVGGVIHINCPLEDPVTHPYKPSEIAPKVPFLSISEEGPKDTSLPQSIIDQIVAAQSGLLCIGQTEPFVNASELIAIINHFNWPTIVDTTQHLAKSLPNVVQSADDAAVALEQHNPDVIVYIGGPWVSKKMAHYIETNANKVIHLTQSFSPVAPMPHKSICTTFNELLTVKPVSSHCLDIEDLNKATQKRLSELPTTSEFGQVTQSLMSLSVTVDCFISNSLPIRYVDQLVLPNVNKLYCNRGASGIDGNIATIAGLCFKETDIPLVAIVGDLAAFYDLNAFLLLKSAKRPFTIVILNNGGGCIFEKLPISKSYDKFDDHFKLKHTNQFTPILTNMGLNCEIIESIDRLNSIEKSQKIVEMLF